MLNTNESQINFALSLTKFWQTLTLLFLTIAISVYALDNLNAKTPPVSTKKNSPMLSQSNVLLTVTNLIAREEKTPPIGIPRQKNRDIGLASVFLTLENRTQKNQVVLIQKIEIINVDDGKAEAFNFTAKTVRLKPLENSEIAYKLSNKKGYSGQDKVKARITYKINQTVHKIESKPIAVERN